MDLTVVPKGAMCWLNLGAGGGEPLSGEVCWGLQVEHRREGQRWVSRKVTLGHSGLLTALPSLTKAVYGALFGIGRELPRISLGA